MAVWLMWEQQRVRDASSAAWLSAAGALVVEAIKLIGSCSDIVRQVEQRKPGVDFPRKPWICLSLMILVAGRPTKRTPR